jgi:outer membrane autotransporter protein
MLNFVGTGDEYEDFNPAVMVAPVAAQMGGYLAQLQSYDEAFNNLDTSMLSEQTNLEGMSSGDETISTLNKGNVWIKPYSGNEKVGLKNGPKVSNDAYGVFAGQDSPIAYIGNGWNGILRGYVGYNSSRQKYDGVRINQKGGTIGASGIAYKDNFFTGLTFNVGTSKAKAKTMYGSEDVRMYMGGLASKTGFNLEFADGKFIVQPNMSMSYSIVDTSSYTNAAGVKVDGDPLYALHLQPELKFIGNLENGWQPYASVAKVWNNMDDTKFKANDVALPELSVKSYTKYGVGIQKMWGEKYTGYIKTDLMNGGRDGLGIQAGFTWKFGKL